MSHKRTTKRRKRSDYAGLQDVRALWESADDPQYPPGTPCERGAPSSADNIWDSTRKSALKQTLHSHPFYRVSPLLPIAYVSRETPDTARPWYAPPLRPSECECIRSYYGKLVVCRLLHCPSGLVQVVKGRGSWASIRRVAEFRLAEQLASTGPISERARWLQQIKEKQERSDFEASRPTAVYARMITKRLKKPGNAAAQ